MYARPLDIVGSHKLINIYKDGSKKTHHISNNFAIFVDSDHARDKSSRRSTNFTVVTLGGVAIEWSAKQAGPIALHSTDAETFAFSSAAKKSIFYHELAKFFQMPTAGDPNIIYEDSQPCIDTIASNSISSRAKHFATPIAFANQQITFGICQPEKIDTSIHPADAGMKPQSWPLLEHVFNYIIGSRYYPPSDSQHAIDMDLQAFKVFHKHAIDTEKDTLLLDDGNNTDH